MECIKCKAEIENDDNFCWKCGHCTSRGYLFFKKDPENIKTLNGSVIKQNDRLGYLIVIFSIGVILFFAMSLIQGKDMFNAYVYLKKQIFNYKYGYNISLLKTDNQYNGISINSLEEAKGFIKKDISNQNWQCSNNLDVYFIERRLSEQYNIPSVNLCDVSLDEAKKIQNVINGVYYMFPNLGGYLTNITITNAKILSGYVAYFQPIYQFVNSADDIDKYNKVNKTQILLNSYYFLNKKILKQPITTLVEDNWYVKDVTWESTIAHELGHYLTFVALLKQNKVNNITFITKDNYAEFNNILKLSNNGSFSYNIVNDALNNYNKKYGTSIDMETFAWSISKYATSKNKNGELLTDETIAEAVHDYYLHGENAAFSSLEIIKVLKEKL